MKKFLLLSGIALLFAVYLTGCGNNDQNARRDVQITSGFSETEKELPSIGIKGNLAAAADGTVFFCDAKGGVYQSKDEGESWEATNAGAGTGSDMVIHTAVSGQGVFAYAAMTETAGFKVFCPGSKKGPEPCIRTDGPVTALAFGENDILYVALEEDNVSSISAIDPQSGEARLVTKTAGRVSHMGASEGILYLREEARVELYDLAAGEMQEEDPVLNGVAGRYTETANFVEAGKSLYLQSEEDGIYVGCEDGLFYYRFGEKEAEQLVDGDMSYFGKSNIRILGLAKTGEETYLALFSDGKLYSYDCSEEGQQVYSHTLKIFSLQKSSAVKAAIEVFRAEHPDVLVVYDEGMIEGSALTAQDVMKNLNTELMSEHGPAVLLMDGLDVEAYTEKGMLLDLTQVLAEVSQEEKLLTNVTESQRKGDGAVYVVPTRFIMPLLGGKKDEIEGVDSLESLADLVEQIREKMPEGPIMETYGARETLELLAMTCAWSWIKDGALQEEKVEEFLIQAKRIYEAEITGVKEEKRQEMLDSRQTFNGVEIKDWTAKILGKSALLVKNEGLIAGMVGEIHGSGIFPSYMQNHKEMTMKLLPGQEGDFLLPSVQVSISSKSKERELAEAFVKTMLVAKSQRSDTEEGLAVNQDALEQMAEKIGHYSYGIDDEDGNEADMDFPSYEGMLLFVELAQNGKCALPFDERVMEVVVSAGSKVLEDQITPEDGMEEIRKKVAIYLAE